MQGKDYWDIDGAAYDEVRKNHSDFDIALTMALTVREKDWDGRFSNVNREWADNFLSSNNIDPSDYSTFYGCRSHSVLLNAFTNVTRERFAERSSFQSQGESEDYEPEIITTKKGRN